ncbi:hypothetical protein MTO96_041697 [Rhipicephalus appendiculatus]
MPPKKELHDVSRSGTPSSARAVKPVDADDAGFSPEGDDILGRLHALTEGAAPSVFAGPVQASDEDDDDAGTSVSGTTAVAAGLPADVGGRVQRRVREIEDEVSRFFSDSTNKVPVPARNFVMSRLFELVAFCGDLRAEAASEKGAGMALQGQLVETRREMAALQTRSLDVFPGFPAVPGCPGLAAADLAGCPGAPVAPPAASGGPRSPRSWCLSLDSGPKPPVEGGTSCVAFPAGNERGASTEPYPPSGSDVLADTLPRRRCRRQHPRLIDFCLPSLAVFNTTVEVNRKEKDGTVSKVSCPAALQDYNHNMNFVDRFDQRKEGNME